MSDNLFRPNRTGAEIHTRRPYWQSPVGVGGKPTFFYCTHCNYELKEADPLPPATCPLCKMEMGRRIDPVEISPQ